jgi:hypothetical protein
MESAGRIVLGFYYAAAVALIFITNGRLGYAADPVEKTESK